MTSPVPYSDAAPPFAAGYFVYRLWSAAGICLYVGCAGARTGRPVPLGERLRRALRDHDWSAEVARYDWAQFGSAEEARAGEREQIRALRPVKNKSMRVCRRGLHDTTRPGSQTADGKCTECTGERMREYLPEWKRRNPGKARGYQEAYRERLGEEEWARRQRGYQQAYRERLQDAAAAGLPGAQDPLF